MNANNAAEQAAALLGRAHVSRLPDPVEYALQAYDDREMLEAALAARCRANRISQNTGNPSQ